MDTSITSSNKTDCLEGMNHKSLPEIQGQTNNDSPNSEGTEGDTTSKRREQEPGATSSNNDHAQNPNPRVRYVKSEFDDGGRHREVPGTRTTTSNSTSQEDSNIAFIVKEFWNKAKTKEKTTITIKGEDLREVMYDIMGNLLEHYQYRNWVAQEQTIDESINELWYWNELSAAARCSRGNKQGREDLQLLIDHLSDIKLDEVKLVKSIASMTKIFAKDLWCLFRPGTLVIAKPYLDEPQLFRVHNCEVKDGVDQKIFVVIAWAFNWIGTELIQEYYNIIVQDYSKDNKEITITDLPCYPLQYYKNSEGAYGPEAVEGLKIYGRQHTYDGELLTDDIIEKSYLFNIKSDIMIDFTAYKRYTPSGKCALGSLLPVHVVACSCQLCFDESINCTQWMQRFAEKAAGNASPAEDNNYLLLPARLLGYCFNTKVWAQFHVDRVGPIDTPDADKADNMMRKLVFPEDSDSVKGDLKVLIEHHGSTSVPLVVDPIKGKGAGLVVLLHGPPGVGKTLTAETLAKCAGKPLYVVGASDIGLDPKAAEVALGHLFELAERWSAVLLIDEADVFLDSRGTKGEADLTKNALVSVMLRVLEYFKGILIMTTNRVMTFDVAMLSRCHYAVNFKSLTLNQEKEIWQGYVDQLTDENSSRKSDIQRWVNQITKKQTNLSGREIRNLFTTAQTLAQAEPDKKILKKHLERVYDQLSEFTQAMAKKRFEQQAMLNA